MIKRQDVYKITYFSNCGCAEVKIFYAMRIIKYTLIFSILLNGSVMNSQTFHPAIDTSALDIKPKIEFLNKYFSADSNLEAFWHPKYLSVNQYNYSELVDGISRNFTPKLMIQQFSVEVTEIEVLNDSLSYFKFFLSSDTDCHIIQYKYYLIEIEGRYYIDNCKDHESWRFNIVETPNIVFFVSPWQEVDSVELFEASVKLDSISKFLKPDEKIPQIESYLCSSMEEMNLLTNMTHYYGYVGGFTHMDRNFIVSHNAPPGYIHEFIHIILGRTGGGSFFLGEGVASYLGGPSHIVSYKDGLKYLRDCFDTGRCTFDLLFDREIYNPRDNIPTYAFAGAICDFIVSTYGWEYFLSLYYDKTVTDENLIDRICSDKKVTKSFVLDSIKNILDNS